MGIRVLIVDDEPLGREALRSLLIRDPQVSRISEAASGREALDYLATQRADVVFLDVQMPDMDGVAVVDEIDRQALPAIVFVTAHEHYAVQAFDRDAVDYLLKPVGAERFARAFAKAKSQIRAEDDGAEPLRQIAVKWQQKVVLIPTGSIDWIRAADDYVELHAGGRSYLLHAALNKLTARLDSKIFFRVHRSIVVNLSAIKTIALGLHGDYDITLQDGTEVRSGRTYGAALKQLLSNSL